MSRSWRPASCPDRETTDCNALRCAPHRSCNVGEKRDRGAYVAPIWPVKQNFCQTAYVPWKAGVTGKSPGKSRLRAHPSGEQRATDCTSRPELFPSGCQVAMVAPVLPLGVSKIEGPSCLTGWAQDQSPDRGKSTARAKGTSASAQTGGTAPPRRLRPCTSPSASGAKAPLQTRKSPRHPAHS